MTDQRQTSGIRVGSVGIPSGASRDEVFAAVSILEDDSLNREPVPGARALRRWRRDAPDGAGFALVAPVGALEPGNEKALADLHAAIEALAPEVVALQPAVAHSPNQQNRDRLGEIVDVLSTDTELVFIPTGLWDPEICLSLAENLELAIAIDPLANDVQDRLQPLWLDQLGRGRAYVRVERLASARRKLDDYELDTLAELVSHLERGWVVFGHPDRLRDGRRFHRQINPEP